MLMEGKRVDLMIYDNIVTHHYGRRMLIETQKKNIRTRAYTHIQSLFPSVFGNNCLPLNYVWIYLVQASHLNLTVIASLRFTYFI
jgi:hypothetical protein